MSSIREVVSMANQRPSQTITIPQPLSVLTPRQISQIDRCLAAVDEFGRVTLILKGGKLRFIERTESVESIPPRRESRD